MVGCDQGLDAGFDCVEAVSSLVRVLGCIVDRSVVDRLALPRVQMLRGACGTCIGEKAQASPERTARTTGRLLTSENGLPLMRCAHASSRMLAVVDGV